MDKFTLLDGVAAPMLVESVDTDVIIPMGRMVQAGRSSLGDYAFEVLRYIGPMEDGIENPEFILNQAPFRNAKILLCGANFGCGSSRETAVWVIKQLGILCVIAPSFGDIFFNNCFQSAVLPIVLDKQVVEDLARQSLQSVSNGLAEFFVVDLMEREIRTPAGAVIPFSVNELRREALLSGLDDIGMTLKRTEQIEEFQQQDRLERPWIYF